MEKTSHKIIIEPAKNYEVRFEKPMGHDADVAFSYFLRNRVIASVNEGWPLFDNFYRTFPPPLGDNLGKEFSSEDEKEFFENVCAVPTEDKKISEIKPVTLMQFGEPIVVDVYHIDSDHAVMALPGDGRRPFPYASSLVAPISTTRPGVQGSTMPHLLTDEEHKIMRNIVSKINENLEIIAAVQGAPEKKETSDGIYDVPGGDDSPILKGLYLTTKHCSWMPQINGLDYLDDIVKAGKAIRNFISDKDAELDKIVQKYVDSASD